MRYLRRLLGIQGVLHRGFADGAATESAGAGGASAPPQLQEEKFVEVPHSPDFHRNTMYRAFRAVQAVVMHLYAPSVLVMRRCSVIAWREFVHSAPRTIAAAVMTSVWHDCLYYPQRGIPYLD